MKWIAPFFAVACLAQTPTTTVVSPFTTATAGTPLTMTATVTPNPGVGYVAFVDGYRTLGVASLTNGNASIVTSFTTGGKHLVKASFRGNTTHLPSASADLTINVQAVAPKSAGVSKQFEYAEPYFVDINRDGRVDLVRIAGSLVVVELLQTNGTYGPAAPYDIGSRSAVGVADFNSDGKVDVAAVDNGNLVIVSGDGMAGFTKNVLPGAQITLPPNILGWGPWLTGDFNRDGAADLALIAFSVSSYYGPDVSIYFGNGTGGFTLAGGSTDPKSAIGDANGDRVLDFAYDTWFRGTVLRYKLACNLLVSAGGSYTTGDDCGAIEVGQIRAGDINTDGKPDLVFNSHVRLGTAPGVFAAPVQYNFGPSFDLKDLFDFNSDGNLDAIGDSQSDLVVRLGNGMGAFPGSVTFPALSGLFKRFEDVNGDGVLDLIYTDHLQYGLIQSSPTVESVAIPSSVQAGTNQTVALTFRDADGAADVKTAILNLSAGDSKSCELTIDVPSKSATLPAHLVFAEGTGWKRTSFCAFDPQSISTIATGNVLTVTMSLVLQADFQGTVQVEARAIDSSSANSGFRAFGSIVVHHSNRQPQPISVTASGQNPTIFTVTMSDPDGLSNFATAELLIGDTTSPADACYIAIDPQSRAVRLMGDAGDQWLGAFMGANNDMANTQCVTNPSAFQYISSTGQQLTFRLPVNFLSFHGPKNLYLRAIDFSGGDSAFKLSGQIQLSPPPAPEPQVLDVQPRTGSGLNATLTGRFRHPNGVNGHYLAYLLILPTPNVVQFTAQGSCLVEYNRISNGVRLINDAGNGWLGPPPGVVVSPGAAPLSNSRCTVDVSKVVTSITGEVLTFTAPVQLTSLMGPISATFIQSLDVTGKWTGMTQFGNWSIPSTPQVAAGPRVVSFSYTPVDANTVNVGVTYSHSTSLSKMSLVHLRIAADIPSNQYCHILYSPALKAINLIDDTGTILLGWRTVNTGALINSRCWAHSYDLATAESNGNGSVSFSVQRTPGNLPANLRFYVNAFDIDGRLTHWVQGGFWQ